MQQEFLSRVSESVAALVCDTEDAAGVEIIVKIDPARTTAKLNEPKPMACTANEHGAQILIGDAANFPDASVFHELQHIRRVLIEGVPRLVVCEDCDDCPPEFYTAIGRLENNLEHLVIVPRDLAKYPAQREYWEDRIGRLVTDLANDGLSNNDRKRHCLLALVLVHHLTPRQDLKDAVQLVAQKLDIEEPAAHYHDSMTAALASKEQMVSITFHYFGLPMNAGCLEYLDSRERTKRVAAIPPVDG